MIRLFGRTGVCLDKLNPDTVERVITRIISVLNKRDFVDILLPWLAEFTNKRRCDNLELVSELIECLLGLLADDTGFLSERVRNEILAIYQSLSQSFQG